MHAIDASVIRTYVTLLNVHSMNYHELLIVVVIASYRVVCVGSYIHTLKVVIICYHMSCPG